MFETSFDAAVSSAGGGAVAVDMFFFFDDANLFSSLVEWRVMIAKIMAVF